MLVRCRSLVGGQVQDGRVSLLPGAGLACVCIADSEGDRLTGGTLSGWLSGIQDKLTLLDDGLSGVDGPGDTKRYRCYVGLARVGGRVNAGIGKGYRRNEFEGFMMPIQEADDRFEECLEVMLKAWTSDEP